MDTNISIGLGNGRMIFLLGGKEPGTKNQEQRRVSASLKLAVFIQITDNRQLITDNRQLKTNISNQLTTNQLITNCIVVTSVYILILPWINRFLHAVIGTTNRPFVSHVRNDEVFSCI